MTELHNPDFTTRVDDLLDYSPSVFAPGRDPYTLVWHPTNDPDAKTPTEGEDVETPEGKMVAPVEIECKVSENGADLRVIRRARIRVSSREVALVERDVSVTELSAMSLAVQRDGLRTPAAEALIEHTRSIFESMKGNINIILGRLALQDDSHDR